METTIVYWRLYWDNGKEHGNYYTGIMEKNMETTIVYWRLYWDNGKEHGNYYSYYSILGLY